MATAKKTTAPKPAAKPVENGAERVANGASEQFDSLFAAFNGNAETIRAQTEEVLDTLRANFEAAQERFAALNADFAEAAREETAEAVDFFNGLTRVTTVSEAIELHRNYWTGRFDAQLERAKSVTKTTMDAAQESFEPVAKSMSALTPKYAFDAFKAFGLK